MRDTHTDKTACGDAVLAEKSKSEYRADEQRHSSYPWVQKKLTSLGIVALLVALIASTTSAYFSASDIGINRYVVQGQQEQGEFSVAIYEQSPDNTGIPDQTGGLVYTGVVPGISYGKEVWVENTSLENRSAWIRVHIKLSHANEWTDLLEGISPRSIFEDSVPLSVWQRELVDPFDPSKGEAMPYLGSDNSLTFTYYYHTPLAQTDKTPKLMERVSIPAFFDAKDMSAIDGFQIVVWAEAIENTDALPHDLDTCQKVFELW